MSPTRQKFRKTVIREMIILAAFVLGAVVLFSMSQSLAGRANSDIYWRHDVPLPQNLAALGLANNEVNAVLMMEAFKADYPQYADAGYQDAVGFYLAEFPAYPHRELLYERIGAAEAKIKTAKGKLSEQKRLEDMATLLRRAGFLVLALYPVTFIARFLLRVKRAKSPKTP